MNVGQRVRLDFVGVEDLLDPLERDEGFVHWEVPNRCKSYELRATGYELPATSYEQFGHVVSRDQLPACGS
jgi:hypothetical protein